MSRYSQVSAWAPASVGNVGVGFDILGHSIDAGGDSVIATRRSEPGVIIDDAGHPDLPLQSKLNTAGTAAQALLQHCGADFGVRLRIHKGLPLGSGMGSSAASAVAAAVAVNELLDAPLPREQLYRCALDGEAVASGGRHGDNVAAQLLGGLVLALADEMVPIPVPVGLLCVLVHPHQVLETRRAREALKAPYPLHQFVSQSGRLAGLLAACYRGDLGLIARSLGDDLVQPRRQALIPGFVEVRDAALAAGALGSTISGAGPSVFAWCTQENAAAIEAAMCAEFETLGIACDAWTGPVAGPAARIVECR